HALLKFRNHPFFWIGALSHRKGRIGLRDRIADPIPRSLDRTSGGGNAFSRLFNAVPIGQVYENGAMGNIIEGKDGPCLGYVNGWLLSRVANSKFVKRIGI